MEDDDEARTASKPSSETIGFVPTLPGGAKPTKPLQNLLPKDHRQRPSGNWYPPSAVTRLETSPDMFSIPDLVPTSSSGDEAVSRRVKKAWMYCISAGPCWELLEDRAFYKEEYRQRNGTTSGDCERNPRPIVYESLPPIDKHVQLAARQASAYLSASDQIQCDVGPFGSQVTRTLAPLSSITLDASQVTEYQLIYTGGPVKAAEWCPTSTEVMQDRGGKQYIAIASMPSAISEIKLGIRQQAPSQATIQIWSVSSTTAPVGPSRPKSISNCDALLCLNEGPALRLKWCPLPTHTPGSLGLLAAVTMNGSVGMYRVPDLSQVARSAKSSGGPAFIKTKPLVSIDLPGTTSLALDWANSETIAIGGTNGYIGVFYVKDAILRGVPVTLTHYFPVHQTPVLSISWIRSPRNNGSGEISMDEDPTMICSSGSAGTVLLTDLRNCVPRLLNRGREMPHATAYSSFCGSVVATDVDFWVKLFPMHTNTVGKGHFIMDLGGTALSIGTSDLHPIVAVGSADGACTTSNLLRGTRREGSVPQVEHKIFQIDYSASTGRYRMLDHFLPQESRASEGTTLPDAAPKGSQTNSDNLKERFEHPGAESSGLWPASIGVSTVAWNSGCGLGSAQWLASGTACGLVRIDFLRGSWIRGTVPYGSVEAIRHEIEGMDDGLSESESE